MTKEHQWLQLQEETRNHEFYCACRNCLDRFELGNEIRKENDRQFQERKKRIEGYRIAA